MKNLVIYCVVALFAFTSCEKEVELDLDTVEPFLVVDAWLTNQTGAQEIILTYTRPYFDNSAPKPALGAKVRVLEVETEKVYSFIDENENGIYKWNPPAPDASFGQIGLSYVLQIEYSGVNYGSFSKMNSAPTIDSITFEFTKKDSFIKQDYYIGEFWARDWPGVGDAYWIKAWKNDEFLNKADEINIAYDAGFSAGGEVDSLIFIQPIRAGISSFEEDKNGEFIPPFLPGDSAYVELHAITQEAWFFLARVMDETFRPGGFAELFANPLANVVTNIVPAEENVKVAGFFNVASVSSLAVEVNKETIRDKLPD